jgi:hypothetical protein
MPYRVNVAAYPGTPKVALTLPEDCQAYLELWRHIEEVREADQLTEWEALMRLYSLGDHYFRLLFMMKAGRDAWDEFRHEPRFLHESHIRLSRILQFEDMDNRVFVGSRAWGKTTHFICDDIGEKLADADHASCWFSLTKGLAGTIVGVIQSELSTNPLWPQVWPDRFWRDVTDRATGAKWSITDGLTIIRKSTRREPSFAAHAFESSLPTGIHPNKRYYDDALEADESAKSEVTAEVLESRWISSQQLSSNSGKRERLVTGTYYSPNGMMMKLSDEYGMEPLIFAGEDLTEKDVPEEEAGPLGGRPSIGFTREALWAAAKKVGAVRQNEDGTWARVSNQKGWNTYGMQIACDPTAAEAAKLDWKWIRVYVEDGRELGRRMSIVVCCDCSTGAGGDPTWIWVWGLSTSRNYYWLDGERRVLVPSARKDLIYQVCSRWRDLAGDVPQLRIEQFGGAEYSDAQAEYHAQLGFPVEPVKCHDTTRDKITRAYERWQGPCQEGRVYFPEKMIRLDERGNQVDLVAYFKQFEVDLFPKPRTDDGLDSGGLLWEKEEKTGPLPWPVARRRRPRHAVGEIAGSFAGAGTL